MTTARVIRVVIFPRRPRLTPRPRFLARRLLSIPDSVDPESIEADYRNGVLHLLLKKRSEVLPKRIKINAK
ncbi:MAG: Hsp20 family protein [Phycisphaera sp. RhM]|nr:Hsp20 family protein [Phycisphaera sp. RhM]